MTGALRARPPGEVALCEGAQALGAAALAGLRRDPMLRIHPADVRTE
jgi:hypothetical protein